VFWRACDYWVEKYVWALILREAHPNIGPALIVFSIASAHCLRANTNRPLPDATATYWRPFTE
jgi:hypothetical protein